MTRGNSCAKAISLANHFISGSDAAENVCQQIIYKVVDGLRQPASRRRYSTFGRCRLDNVTTIGSVDPFDVLFTHSQSLPHSFAIQIPQWNNRVASIDGECGFRIMHHRSVVWEVCYSN